MIPLVQVVVVAAAVVCAAVAHADEAAWQEVARADISGRPLVVSSRSRPGTDIREVRGLGSFEAPPWIVKNVIDDVLHYKDFLPYSSVSDVLSTHDGYIVSYQRIKAPLVSDRDYTVKIFDESKQDSDGKITWKNRWSLANELGPPPVEGVVRLSVNEGYWLLEDIDNGKHTKVTYYVYTNPGGALPSFIVNAANTQAVPGLLQAVAKASADKAYAATRPAVRSRAAPVVSPGVPPGVHPAPALVVPNDLQGPQ